MMGVWLIIKDLELWSCILYPHLGDNKIMLKRFVFLVVSTFVLVACGSEDSSLLSTNMEHAFHNNDVNGQLALYDSIRENDFRAFKTLLDKGVDPNFFYEGETWDNRGGILELAVMAEDDRFLIESLKHGGDPNSTNRYRTDSILITAIMVSDLNKVKILLDNGADLNKVGASNLTPFHRALRVNNYDIAFYLLQQGADTETPNKWGVTPKQTISRYGGKGLDRDSKQFQYYLKVKKELEAN